MNDTELIQKIWKDTWDIIKVSNAYREERPLKDCKPMLMILFEAAMYRLAKEIKEGLRE